MFVIGGVGLYQRYTSFLIARRHPLGRLVTGSGGPSVLQFLPPPRHGACILQCTLTYFKHKADGSAKVRHVG